MSMNPNIIQKWRHCGWNSYYRAKYWKDPNNCHSANHSVVSPTQYISICVDVNCVKFYRVSTRYNATSTYTVLSKPERGRRNASQQLYREQLYFLDSFILRNRRESFTLKRNGAEVSIHIFWIVPLDYTESVAAISCEASGIVKVGSSLWT
jgi:hypothetical protein